MTDSVCQGSPQATNHNQQREKAPGVRSRGDQACKGPLPAEPHRTHSAPAPVSCDNTCEVLSTGDTHQRLGAQGWSCRNPLPGTDPSSKLPGGEQMLGINQPGCTNSAGAVSCSNQSRECGYPTPEIRVPRPAKGHSVSSQACMGSLSCTAGQEKGRWAGEGMLVVGGRGTGAPRPSQGHRAGS